MKYLFLLLATVQLCFFSAHIQAMDLIQDQDIIEILQSNKFSNTLLHYAHNGKKYPIRIIWNPQKETLWGSSQNEPTSMSLFIIANVPIPLARYIEDLVLELRGSYKDASLFLKNGTPEKEWESVKPVYIAESINDPLNDQIIHDTFNSKVFVNKIIYYHYDKEYYRVRLLHNPELRSFTETKHYDLNGYGSKDYAFAWNKKYAILFEFQTPQELVDHVSARMKSLSYWDWYFNYTLSNGSYIIFTHKLFGSDVSDNWELDTWFDMTKNF